MLLERRAGGDPELQRLMRPICDRQERGSKLQALQEALGARIHTLETQSAAARSTYDALSTAVSPQQRSNPATWSGGLAPPHFKPPPLPATLCICTAHVMTCFCTSSNVSRVCVFCTRWTWNLFLHLKGGDDAALHSPSAIAAQCGASAAATAAPPPPNPTPTPTSPPANMCGGAAEHSGDSTPIIPTPLNHIQVEHPPQQSQQSAHHPPLESLGGGGDGGVRLAPARRSAVGLFVAPFLRAHGVEG
jgi:hypothetical protein